MQVTCRKTMMHILTIRKLAYLCRLVSLTSLKPEIPFHLLRYEGAQVRLILFI